MVSLYLMSSSAGDCTWDVGPHPAGRRYLDVDMADWGRGSMAGDRVKGLRGGGATRGSPMVGVRGGRIGVGPAPVRGRCLGGVVVLGIGCLAGSDLDAHPARPASLRRAGVVLRLGVDDIEGEEVLVSDRTHDWVPRINAVPGAPSITTNSSISAGRVRGVLSRGLATSGLTASSSWGRSGGAVPCRSPLPNFSSIASLGTYDIILIFFLCVPFGLNRALSNTVSAGLNGSCDFCPEPEPEPSERLCGDRFSCRTRRVPIVRCFYFWTNTNKCQYSWD